MDRFRKNKKNTPSSNQKTSSKQRRPKASKSPKNSKVAVKGQKMQDLGHVDSFLCQPNSPTIVPVSPNKWGLIRVHLGDIIPETVYKTVLVTPETTTNEVLKNVVETVNGLPPNMTVNDFCLQEAQDGPQGSYYRVLGASECPWLVHSKWDGTSGWSFRLSWRSKQIEDRMKTPLSTRRALSPTPISIHMDPNSRESALDNGSTRGRSSSLALTPRNLVRSGCCDLDEDECNASGGGERNSIARTLIERFFHSNATEGKTPPGASLSTLTPEQWQRYLEISTSISSPERQLPSVRPDSSVIEEPADLECVFEETSMVKKPADSPFCSSSHDYAQFLKSHPMVPRNSPVCQGSKPTSDSKDQFFKSVTMPFVAKRQKCSNSAKRRLVKSSHICRDFAISESESVRKQQTESEPHVPEPEGIQKDSPDEQSGGILPSTPPSSKLTHSSSCPSFQEKWQVLNAEISVALETGISGVMNRVISEMGQSPLPIKVRRWHSLKTPDAKPLLFTKHVIPRLTMLGSASSELEEEEEVIIEPNILVKRVSTVGDHTMQNNESNANTSNLDHNRCVTDDDHTLDDSVFSPLESEMSKVSDIPSTDEGISSPSPLFSSTYCSTTGRDPQTSSTAPGTETKPVEYDVDFASMSFNDGFSSTDVSANSSRMGYRDNQQPHDDCRSNSETMTSPGVGKTQMSSDIKEPITEGEIPIALNDECIAQVWTKLEEDSHQMKGNLPILMELTVMPSKAPDYLNVKGLRPASDIFQRPLSKVVFEATEYLGDDDKRPLASEDRECGDHDNDRTTSKNLTGSGEVSILESHSHASSPSGSTNTNASNNCDTVHTHGLSDPSSSPISTELVLGIKNSEEDTRIHHHLIEGRFLGQFGSEDVSIDVDDVSIMVKIEEDVQGTTISDQNNVITDVDHLQRNTLEVGRATTNQTTPPKVAIELPPTTVEEVQEHQQHTISHQQARPLTEESCSATDSATLHPKLELVRFSSPLQNQRKGSLSKQDLDVDADFLLWEGSDYGFIDDEDEILPPLPVTPNSPVTFCATPGVNRAVCQGEQIERTNSYRKSEEREDFLDDFSSETSTSDSGDDVPLDHFDFEDDDEDWLESSLEDDYRSNLEEYGYMHRGQMSSTKVLVDLASEYGKGKYHFPFLAVIEEDPAEEQEERDYLALHESLWKTEMQEFEEMERLVEVMVNEEREPHTPETVIEVSSNDGSVEMYHHGNSTSTMQEQVLSKVQHHTTNSGSYKLMGAPITQSSLEQQYQLTTTTTTTTTTPKNVGREIPSSPVQKLASLDAESKCKPSPVKPRDRALKNVSVADIKKRLMKSLTTEEDEPKQITPHRGCVKNTGSTTVTTVYEPTGEVTKSNRELSDSPGRRTGSNKKDKVKDGLNSELTVEGNQGEGNLVGKPLKPDIAPPSPPLFKSRGSSPLTCSEKSLTPPLATGEHLYRKSPDTSLRISNLFSGTRRPATSNKVKALSMKFDKAN